MLNRGANLRLLVDRQIVEHDDIAWSERGHQHLFDIGEEAWTINRAIEDGRGAQFVEAQGCDHRVRLPMAARRVIAESHPAGTATVPPQQIRRHAAFIEKHVTAYIANREPLAPQAPSGRDIRPTLFVGVYGFF